MQFSMRGASEEQHTLVLSTISIAWRSLGVANRFREQVAYDVPKKATNEMASSFEDVFPNVQKSLTEPLEQTGAEEGEILRACNVRAMRCFSARESCRSSWHGNANQSCQNSTYSSKTKATRPYEYRAVRRSLIDIEAKHCPEDNQTTSSRMLSPPTSPLPQLRRAPLTMCLKFLRGLVDHHLDAEIEDTLDDEFAMGVLSMGPKLSTKICFKTLSLLIVKRNPWRSRSCGDPFRNNSIT